MLELSIKNPKKRHRSMAVSWNQNYESLKDGFGAFEGKAWIQQVKEDVCDELDVCTPHVTVNVTLDIDYKKVNVQVTKSIYAKVNPLRNKIYIELDNEHCANCKIGQYSTKKEPRSISNAKKKRNAKAALGEAEEQAPKKQKEMLQLMNQQMMMKMIRINQIKRDPNPTKH